MKITIKSKDDRYFENVYYEQKNKPNDISICVKTKDKIVYFQLFKIEGAIIPYFPLLHVRYKGIEYALWCT